MVPQGHRSRRHFCLSNIESLYKVGQRVPQDYSKAIECFQKAAAQGKTQTQGNIGYLNAFDLGVSKDEAQAVGWFKKVVEQGHSVFQLNLATMYNEGLGVAIDQLQVMECYTKVANQKEKKRIEKMAKTA